MKLAALLADPWWNFAVVIGVQFLTFFLFHRFVRTPLRSAVRILCISAIAGVPFGVFFDIYTGSNLGFFNYLIGQNYVFVGLNAIFSYGLAIGTAAAFKGVFFTQPLRLPHYVVTVSGIILILGAATFIHSDASLLSRMFGTGTIIVALIEVGASWFNHSGPVLKIADKSPAPLALLWSQSVIVGLIYELANYLFPVWHWALSNTENPMISECVIIGFGYAVLFYPMLLFWHILFKIRGPILRA
jgi:hypothetical protein